MRTPASHTRNGKVALAKRCRTWDPAVYQYPLRSSVGHSSLGGSSIGRTTVFGTVCCRFESCPPSHFRSVAYVYKVTIPGGWGMRVRIPSLQHYIQGIAQEVECRTRNAEAVDSSPTTLTILRASIRYAPGLPSPGWSEFDSRCPLQNTS